jgi:hypothetical protein
LDNIGKRGHFGSTNYPTNNLPTVREKTKCIPLSCFTYDFHFPLCAHAGERPLADYCTTYRGRGVAPASEGQKKRPAAEIRAAAEAKKKKQDQIKANAAARPALQLGADGSFVLQQVCKREMWNRGRLVL